MADVDFRTIAHFKIIDTNVFTCSSLIFECNVIKIKTYEFEQNPILKSDYFFFRLILNGRYRGNNIFGPLFKTTK